MKTAKTAVYVIFGFLGATCLLVPSHAIAQAAPGPLPPPQSRSQPQGPGAEPQAVPAAKPKPAEVPPRTTLAGAWKMNHDQSDDPRQRIRAAEGADVGSYPGGGSPGGSYPGGGYPGGYPRGRGGRGYPYPGRGAGGPYGGPGPGYGGQDIENNPKMQPLLRPAESLMVDLKDPEIDVTEDQYRKLTLYTDGRQLQKSTDDNHQEIAAHWDGSRLVSDEKSPLGGKMNRTFELFQDGRQLYETLRIDTGRSKTPIVIRYVYDILISRVQNREDSDPNRPILKKHSDDAGSSSQ